MQIFSAIILSCLSLIAILAGGAESHESSTTRKPDNYYTECSEDGTCFKVYEWNYLSESRTEGDLSVSFLSKNGNSQHKKKMKQFQKKISYNHNHNNHNSPHNGPHFISDWSSDDSSSSSESDWFSSFSSGPKLNLSSSSTVPKTSKTTSPATITAPTAELDHGDDDSLITGSLFDTSFFGMQFNELGRK